MLFIILQSGLFVLGGVLGFAAPGDSLARYEFSQPHMGTLFKIILYAETEAAAQAAAQAAYARVAEVNRKLSDYDPESELSKLSAATSDGPMTTAAPVSDDLWKVLVEAQETSRSSQGAFDVTVGPLTRLWRQSRRAQRLPEKEKLQAALAAVGFEAIELDAEHQAVRLLKANMRLDLGGIAKGYATDEALEVLKERGIRRALIDAGGGMTLGEPPPGEKGWKVALASLDPAGTPAAFVLLSNCGVATSGDAHQYVEIDGVRYSHIVDPRTGMGLTERMSASAIAPTGMQADALTKAICILGAEAGLKIIDATPSAAGLMVVAVAGRIEVVRSKRVEEFIAR